MLYRLFTENVNQEGIREKVSSFFEGFTLIPSIGYWKGKPENSLIIEIIGNSRDQAKVFALAKAIKEMNNQETVMVEKLRNLSRLI